MYSDKTNINILTSLLVRHGIRHAVVCPGSRNGAIIHNLNECPDIKCYAVTDERSAGFYALGMAKIGDFHPSANTHAERTKKTGRTSNALPVHCHY